MLEECIAEEVGHGMKAHLNVNRNDPVEGMTKGTNSLKREAETDLRMIEKLLGYNKERKEMRMVIVS